MDIRTAHEDLVRALTPTLGRGEARAVARIVLEDVFDWHGGRRSRAMSPDEVANLNRLADRLLAGEPVQYLVGRADFFGLKLRVTPAVLIPRPETEELVEWALEWLGINPTARAVLDIGTGSGCIPIAVAKKRSGLQVTAVDISTAALAIAEDNAARNAVRIAFRKTDILDPQARQNLGEFDLIISNPPYIPERERGLMEQTVLAHEPGLALFVSDADPLLFYREILDFAVEQLGKAGAVLFECNEFNIKAVDKLAKARGFLTEIRTDLQRKPRMLLAAKP